MKNFVVAIDGPAGSGKTSISTIVASKLGFTHIDTGAMFRAVTLEALRRGIDLNNEDEYDFLNEISVVYKNGIIYLNDVDVSKEIRTEEVTNAVSTPSKFKVVRDKMLHYQRESAKHGMILMDGRDIGSVVLPNADLKIFLTASQEERAKRRCLENEGAGINSNYEEILEEIKVRDYKDSHRQIAPLKQASDAILIDTTNMSIDDVCNKIIELINERLYGMEKFDLYSGYDYKELEKGDVVTATVVSIYDDKTIYLDVHSRIEGLMHLDHFTKDPNATSFYKLVKVGDTFKCQVTKVDEDHIYLSRLNQLSDENFKNVIDAFENEQTIKVTVKSETKGGFVVDYKGNQLFMPKSQSATAKVNDVIEVKILEAALENKKAVVSRKAITQAIFEEEKQKEYESINVGDILTGKIVKVEKYGAIVKFNFNQGLLKANQVAHEFVDITKVLSVGDDIDVKVVGKADGKLTLSRKALLKTPFELYVEEHKVSDKVIGKVVNKLGFGLLLELAPNIKGLLHKNEYSHNPNDNLSNCVKIGDELEVAIIKIDLKGEKISLSRKALMDNPWEKVNAKVGDVCDVKVTEVKSSGLTVSTLGVDGFIPQSEVFQGDKKDDVEKYFAVGDETKAVITEINPKEWKLKLSIKKLLDAEERKSYEKYLDENEKIDSNIGDMFKDVLEK